MAMIKNIAVLLLALSQLVVSQDLGSLPPCGRTCVQNVQAQFGSFNCASASDFACMCTAGNFKNGIMDCNNGDCLAAGDREAVVVFFNTVLCPGAAAPAPAPTTNAPEAPAATTAAPEPTPVTTEAPPITTSEAPAVTTAEPPATSEQPAPAPTTEQPATSAPQPTPSTSTTSEALAAVPTTTSPSSTPATTLVATGTPTPSTQSTTTTASKTSSTSSSQTASKTAEPTESQSKSGSPSGLSISAIAGISAGGAAIVLAVLVLTILRCRRRRADRKGTYMSELKISPPMPGAGRYYGHDLGHPQQPPTPNSPGSAHSSDDLEMRSRRYEDMVPRTAPRLIG